MAPGASFANHAAWAAKLPEKVLRLAAQFHFCETMNGSEIDGLAMHRAIVWGNWYADEYMRLFGPFGWMTPDVRDAIQTLKCLTDYVTNYRDFNYLSMATVETLCLEKVKIKARLKKALNLLSHCGHIFPIQQGKSLSFQMNTDLINNLTSPSIICHSRFQ